jgi:hypothetical protein
MYPMQVTGSLVDDVHIGETPIAILQANNFLKCGNDPLVYFSVITKTLTDAGVTKTVWASTARQLLGKAVLALVNAASLEMDQAAAERKKGNTKATKPADLYRKYSAALRAAAGLKVSSSLLATETLRELYLEQTLGDGDLETADYIDAYTGETELTFEQLIASLPERHPINSRDEGELKLLQIIFMPGKDDGDGFDGVAPIISTPGTELERQAEQCREHLGWDDNTVKAFLAANRQFIGGEDEEEPGEDRGFVPATLQERELVIDRPAYYQAMKLVAAFNKRRSEIFERMKILKINQQNWYKEFRIALTASDEYTDLLNEIERLEAVDITTAAAVALLVATTGSLEETGEDVIAQDGYGLIASDFRPGLIQYIEAWQDDLVELINDSSPNGVFPTTESDIERYDQVTLRMLAEKMPEYHVNPMQTRSWNMAYLQALANGATFQEADESAWAAWRFAMSSEAADAYNKEYLRTNDRKQAMRAFWQKAPLCVPRPQEHIKAIRGDKMGLVLVEKERRIDWWVATRKAKNNELALTEETKTRLKAVLANIPQAKEFLAVL